MRSKKRSDLYVKKQFYFTIISSVMNTGKLPSEKKTGVSKQARNPYIKRLKLDGVIHKRGYGVWEVDQKKAEDFLMQKEVKRSKKCTLGVSTNVPPKNLPIRGHNYQIKLHIRDSIELKKILIRKYNGKYINKGGTARILLYDRIIWINKNSIIVHFKPSESIFADSASDASKSAIYEFRRTIRRIENDIGRMLWINKEYQIEILRAEYANINNELAKDFNRRQDKLKVIDNGKCWLLIDNSFNLNECETVGMNSEINMDGVVMPFFNDIKRQFEREGKPVLFSDLLGMQLRTQEQLYSVSQVLASQYKPADDGRNSKLNNYIG